MHNVIARFIDMYNLLSADNLSPLELVYHKDIQFIDPLHHVTGLSQLKSYFANMYANVQTIHFDIKETFDIEGNGFVYWQMRFQHKRINGGKEVVVNGHSHLRFEDDKIIYHQDYFDAAAMLYRNIPLLKQLIGFIDKRAAK
ncbi:nuclear transport factor 2 family protein [Pseudoalteromonas sp. JBTF-M23]|uniref:Nuclear transport factor 2 family protein n=1 Tax=Pseudoalteromonas caenipelagi TaxID=2726988 RepID=A0A849VC02_9GAMM|nr:nuclear transport factor 2 family protein [Pseudoalteromonas caenipelagi]NOU50320.1 nuclear transport factor 2 family protein [Pseudoalteromonas caenipelagi]